MDSQLASEMTRVKNTILVLQTTRSAILDMKKKEKEICNKLGQCFGEGEFLAGKTLMTVRQPYDCGDYDIEFRDLVDVAEALIVEVKLAD